MTDTAVERLAAALQGDGPVTIGTMFRSPGIRVEGKIVAFLGHDGDLIVKVPRARAEELVAAGTAEPVTMGVRTMREWVSVPAAVRDAGEGEEDSEATGDAEATFESWLSLAREALTYVRNSEAQGSPG